MLHVAIVRYVTIHVNSVNVSMSASSFVPFVNIATSVAATSACKKLNIFIILDTFTCLYAFVGFISTSN